MLVQQETEELRRVETVAAQHRWRLNHLWTELQCASGDEDGGFAGYPGYDENQYEESSGLFW